MVVWYFLSSIKDLKIKRIWCKLFIILPNQSSYIMILFNFEQNAYYSIVHFGWLQHIEVYIDFRYVFNLNIFDWVRTRCWEDDIKLMTLIDLTILLLSGCKNRLRWAFCKHFMNCLEAEFLWAFIHFCKWSSSPPLHAKWWSKFAKRIAKKPLTVALYVLLKL